MKIIFVVIVSFLSFSCLAQEALPEKEKLSWYISPEAGAMFLPGHVGKTIGFQAGLRFFKDHLKVGYFFYGRSGPINNETFSVQLQEGVTYKGKSQLELRADHGAFGLMIAPSFRLPGSRIECDIPLYIGSLGAGFYLAGDDRKTPDGRRVSEWENELFLKQDAGFAGLTEVGLRMIFPTKNPHVKIGVGVHYAATGDWKTYYDPAGDFYNNKFRSAIFIQFANSRTN